MLIVAVDSDSDFDAYSASAAQAIRAYKPPSGAQVALGSVYMPKDYELPTDSGEDTADILYESIGEPVSESTSVLGSTASAPDSSSATCVPGCFSALRILLSSARKDLSGGGAQGDAPGGDGDHGNGERLTRGQKKKRWPWARLQHASQGQARGWAAPFATEIQQHAQL
jgi:hypothetical protein